MKLSSPSQKEHRPVRQVLPRRGGDFSAFSLIEVTISIGIVAFALIAVVGLLPVGLSSQKQANEQATGVQALARISEALQGVYLKAGSNTFLPPVSDLDASSGPKTYYLQGNGTLTASPAGARQVIYIKNFALTGARTNLLPVYVSVAWPSVAEYSGTNWTKQQGSVSTFLYINLPQ